MFMYLFFGIVAMRSPSGSIPIRPSASATDLGRGEWHLLWQPDAHDDGLDSRQIYRLTKAGQNVGEAGATQFTRFIVYQFGLVAWGAILLPRPYAGFLPNATAT